MDNLILTQIPLEELLALVKQAVREEISASTGKPGEANKTASPPITQAELCEFLGITPQTAIRYRQKGKIPFMTIGSAVRFDKDEVIAALKKKIIPKI